MFAEILLVLVQAAHLLCVDVAAAGPIVCLWLEWREARGHAMAGRAGRYLANASLLLLLIGAMLGVAVGALMWSDVYRDALRRMPSKIHFGVWELLFSLVLMAIYVAWWRWVPKPSAWHRAGRALLPLLAGTNLLYHFPFLFAVIAYVVDDGQIPAATIDAAVFRNLVLQPIILSRVTHFVLAAFAVTGVVLIGFALRLLREGCDQAEIQKISSAGGRLALVPTLLQLPVGIWVIMCLPQHVQHRFMGGSMADSFLLILGILGALLLMHQLSAISLGDARRKTLVAAMATMILVVLLMTAVLQRSRATVPGSDTASRSHGGKPGGVLARSDRVLPTT